jgi:hypothetical protein
MLGSLDSRPVLLLLLSARREEVARAVGNRHFTFSLLVHSDASSPMVDWSQNSSILQVSYTNSRPSL